MMKRCPLLAATVFFLMLATPVLAGRPSAQNPAYPPLAESDTLGALLVHPAFAGFAERLLPWENRAYDPSLPLARLGELMPYHRYFHTPDIVGALNHMIAQAARGEAVFYELYSDTQQGRDPQKAHTGLFVFKGRLGAPTALIAPGGGFQYVGSLHEGFPIAKALADKGYNAVVLKYRTGSATKATQDMAAAVDFLFAHQTRLNIDMRGYSVWGASAGARMAASIGSYGTAVFGACERPRPAAVVMLYTGHSDVGADEPPTFIAVGTDDGIAPPAVMRRRADALQSSAQAHAQGITVTHQAEMTFQAAPGENFTGTADFSRYPVMPSKGDVAPALVRFSPGARTNWHTHPNGQYLIIIDGVGWVQEWDRPAQAVKKGDVVWFGPGVKHWHGAGANTPMAHIAISPVDASQPNTQWLEQAELPPTPASAALGKQGAAPLTAAQLGLTAIAAHAARGDLPKLEAALHTGLDNGLSVVQIKEAISHLYAYIGAPRTLNAMAAFKKIVDEKGADQPLPPHSANMPDNAAYYQLGTETLAALSKAPTQRPIFDFAPALDYSIKAHLFGYLFSRTDLLSAVDRELTTLGALAGLGGVNGQMRSHFTVVKNLGFQPAHMQQVLDTIGQTLGQAEKDNAQQVLAEVQS